jgi:hypothetical protein
MGRDEDIVTPEERAAALCIEFAREHVVYINERGVQEWIARVIQAAVAAERRRCAAVARGRERLCFERADQFEKMPTTKPDAHPERSAGIEARFIAETIERGQQDG